MSDQPSQSETPIRQQSPVAEVWTIAWPTVLTMTSYTIMQFVDSLMVAQVGPVEVAAQGNGGIWAFAPLAFAMGLLTVVNTYVSQHLGAGRPQRGAAYGWAAIWMSFIIWFLVMLPWAAALPWVFGAMGHSEELRKMETGYGQILLVGCLVILISRGLHHYFFGMHRPKIVTTSAISGNIVNVGMNYVLIFGEDGLPALGLPGIPGVPALGVYGAAIGTVIGCVVEMIIPLAVFLGPSFNRTYGTRAMWRPRVQPIRDILRIGWPASVQFGNEITCWAIFMSVLVGRFGEAHLAAGWAAMRFMHLSFMPIIGFSVATTSLVGRYIGAGEPSTGVSRTRLAMGMAVAYMAVCAVIFIVFRHELIGLYVRAEDVDPAMVDEIVRIGAILLICIGIFQTADAVGIVYTGGLRGAGDTVVPGLLTIVYSWMFIVLGGWLFTEFVPQIESLGPWIALAVYLTVYSITMAVRFESGRWRSIRLFGHEEDVHREASKVAPISPAPPASAAEGTVRDFADEIPGAMQRFDPTVRDRTKSS